jgi:hypothetical protein
MIVRRDSLPHALTEVEAKTLSGAAIIVVSRTWWDELSAREQSVYRSRAGQAGIELRVDESLSTHFVEVRDGDEGPPLSTESPL